MSKPPLSLPPTTDAPLKVTLLIGSSLYSPLSIHLFDLVVPRSAPAPIHPDEASFHPLPEIKHTFRPDQKLPPRPISAIFAVLVLSPWVVLLSLVRCTIPLVPSTYANHVSTVDPSSTHPNASLLTQRPPLHSVPRRV